MSGHIIRGATAVADCAEPFTVVSRTAVTVLAISQKLLQKLPKQLMTDMRQIVLQQLQWISSRAQEKLPIDGIWAALQDQGTNVNQAGGNSAAAGCSQDATAQDGTNQPSVFAQSVFLRRKGMAASSPLVEGLQATLQDVPQQELRTLMHTDERQKQRSASHSFLSQSPSSTAGRCANCRNTHLVACGGLQRVLVLLNVLFAVFPLFQESIHLDRLLESVCRACTAQWAHKCLQVQKFKSYRKRNLR